MTRTTLADAAVALTSTLSDEDVLSDGATDHNPHDWCVLAVGAEDDGRDYAVRGDAIYRVRSDSTLDSVPIVKVRR